MGCICAYWTSVKAPLILKRYIQVWEKQMLPFKQRLFQGHACLFQPDNAKPHSSRVTTASLWNQRVWVLDSPASSSERAAIENLLPSWRAKDDNGHPALLTYWTCTSSNNGKEFQQHTFDSCYPLLTDAQWVLWSFHIFLPKINKWNQQMANQALTLLGSTSCQTTSKFLDVCSTSRMLIMRYEVKTTHFNSSLKCKWLSKPT